MGPADWSLEEIWEERISPGQKKKKKNPLGYKKKDGEERESNSLEMLRAEAIMSPAAWCDPGELGPQRVSDRCWCSWAVRTISQRMPRP